MNRSTLLEMSADELVTASERLVSVATCFRALALLCNVDSSPERLQQVARTVQGDVTRLVTAAISAARASARVATVGALGGEP